MNRNRKYMINSLIVFAAFVLFMTVQSGQPGGKTVYASVPESEHTGTWIVKWDGEPDSTFWNESESVKQLVDQHIFLVRPIDDQQTEAWIHKWSTYPSVIYMQPNHRIKIEREPNDSLLSMQSHLDLIGARKAWDTVTSNTSIKIALIDTGVDLEHPDLKRNLVEGINLLDKDKPPQDDNGHGTHVAGVLAAVGNNRIGVTGVMWNARIMPIKMMESNGFGSELELGEGIRYAVDNDAKIIVIPLGLYKYSPYLAEAVQYAENRGVLIVAAAGNDGQVVKYPAAYPTVLAVGGIHDDKSIVEASNYGQTLDVLAPWRVHTTAKNGSFAYDQGTSMATPQVAAAAALIWAKYPDLKPYQIRDLIRHTAEPIGGQRWSERTGYGLLRIDRALETGYHSGLTADMGRSMDTARRMPIGKMVSGMIDASSVPHWFMWDTRYDGEIRLRVQTDRITDRRNLEITVYESSSDRTGTKHTDVSREIVLPVSAGQRGYVKLETKDSSDRTIAYRITSNFQIAPDPFEDNDRQYRAYMLPTRSQSITGNFHQLNDVDWYVLQVEQEGLLSVEVSTDTYQIDLDLWVQRQGEEPYTFDNGVWGETEYSGMIDVFPGKYYIRVTNVIAGEAYPTIGEYTLSIHHENKHNDPNEPNNRTYQATRIVNGQEHPGLIHPDDDEDWFTFRIDEESYVQLQLSDIPKQRIMSMSLFDNRQNQISLHISEPNKNKMEAAQILQPGQYYVRITANQSFRNQLYKIAYTAEPLDEGFRDITGHWARDSIVDMSGRGLISGYSDFTFRPDREMTRAEAAVLLEAAFNFQSSETAAAFRDLPEQHWAHDSIQNIYQAGIVTGYPDRTFRPSQPVTRAEMMTMLAQAAGLEAEDDPAGVPFTDIPEDHWALPFIATMKERGWAGGYVDGTFRLQKWATRSEFVSLVYRMLTQP